MGWLSKWKEALENAIESSIDVVTDVAEDATDFAGDVATEVLDVADDVADVATDVVKDAVDLGESFAATACVVTTSVVSGVFDIVEGVADGVIWSNAKVVEGASWAVGEVVGLIDEEAGQDVMNFREGFKKGYKEIIAADVVGDLNKAFYENTEIGKRINEQSALKYDSEIAQGIRNGAEIVGKVAAATALTVVTGGTAAPLAAGFLFGVGDHAERTYQTKGTDTTMADEFGIGLSGVGEAANWYGLGKLGQAGVGFVSAVKEVGLKSTGAEIFSGVKGALSTLKNSSFKDAAKTMFSKDNMLSALKTAAMDPDNAVDSIATIADDVSDFAVGDKEFNFDNAMKMVGELSGAFVLNVGFEGLGNYLRSSDDVVDAVKTTNNIDDIVNTADESSDGLIDAINTTNSVDEIVNTVNGSDVSEEKFTELVKNKVDTIKTNLNIENIDKKSYKDIIENLDSISEKEEFYRMFVADDTLNWDYGVRKYIAEELYDEAHDTGSFRNLSISRQNKIVSQLELTSKDLEYRRIAIGVDRRLLGNEGLNKIKQLEKDGVFKDGWDYEKILDNYFSEDFKNIYDEDYMKIHILEHFPIHTDSMGKQYIEGVTFQSADNSAMGIINPKCNGNIGRDEGAYVTSVSYYENLLRDSSIFKDGVCINSAALTHATGGVYVGANPIAIKQKIYVKDMDEIVDNFITSGNDDGAFIGDWMPGMFTSGDAPELKVPQVNVFNEDGSINKNVEVISHSPSQKSNYVLRRVKNKLRGGKK